MTLLHKMIFVVFAFAAANGFGSEDRFVKRFAMMKIYESCFGADVVKQIRKEMKAACAKCAAQEQPPTTLRPPPEKPAPPSFPPKLNSGVMDPDNTIYANSQTFENEKFNPAILAYRPAPYPGPMLRPYPGALYPAVPPQPGPMFFAPYPGPSPYAGGPYGFPFLPQRPFPYIPPRQEGQRVARDLDVKQQLEFINSRLNSRGKNVTCVMQELGYLDEHLEPNYNKIQERIGSLPVAEDLRADILEGINFCRQFAQCIPETNKEKSPLSRELIRPMFFFKCYKHKKLEACIMKDIHEKYSGADEDFDTEMELRRNGKEMKIMEKDLDELAVSIYEFLYGADSSTEFDSFF